MEWKNEDWNDPTMEGMEGLIWETGMEWEQATTQEAIESRTNAAKN